MDINILYSLKKDPTSFISLIPLDIIDQTKPYLEYNYLESQLEYLQKKSNKLLKILQPLEKDYNEHNNEYIRLKKICDNLSYKMHQKNNIIWELNKKKEIIKKEEKTINQDIKELQVIREAILFKNAHLPENYSTLKYSDLEKLTDNQLIAYVVYRDIKDFNMDHLKCSTMISKLFETNHLYNMKSRKSLLEYIELFQCSVCGGLDHDIEKCLDIDAFMDS